MAKSPNNLTASARARADWETLFLATLRAKGNVSAAARVAGVSRPTAYEHRDRHEDFAAEWRDAVEEAADGLEEEARRRAVEGVEKPIYQGGNEVGAVTEYSDTLLVTLLKAHLPHKYRERHEVSGPDGAPLEITIAGVLAAAKAAKAGRARGD